MSSQNKHTLSTHKQSHAHTLHMGTSFPSRLLRLPLKSRTPATGLAWMSFSFSFPASAGASIGGTASGRPHFEYATGEGAGEEQTGSSYSQEGGRGRKRG